MTTQSKIPPKGRVVHVAGPSLQVIEVIAREDKITPEEVLRRGLSLLQACRETKASGCTVAVLDADGKPVAKIEGF